MPRGLAPLLLALAVVPLLASAGSARPVASLGFVRLATGLDQPVYVTAPAGEPGRLYVVEKTGRVRVLVDGVLQQAPFLDLSGDVSTDSERGLLSIAFDQRYAANHFVYTYSTDPAGNIRVDRFTAAGGSVDTATRTQLLAVAHPTYSNHDGGLLIAAPDRRLYVGLGDGGSGGDPDDNAQNPASRLGKLLSLDLVRPSSGWRLIALGLRNPWRASFDRETGDLYLGDVGQDAWEEVDVVRVGDSLLNLGWPVFEAKAHYRDAEQSHYGRLVAPVYVYPHTGGTCAVTGGYVYRGANVPAARGRYVFGDFCTGTVWTMKVTDGKATGLTTLAQRLPQLSSFGEDAAGELYATTLDGSLYRFRQ